MQSNKWCGAVLAGILIAILAVPPDAWTAARQQEGPQTPPQEQQPQAPKPPTGQQANRPQQPPQTPQVAISVESRLVSIDAVVTDQDGNLVTGLKKDNFKVFDDGQLQEVTNFAPTEAPITIVILMEFSNLYWGRFGYKAQYWADGFLQTLKPQDWVALKTFDLNTTIRVDFTQDKRQIDEAIRTLGFATFREANLFDAVHQTLDQLRDVKGKKSILLLATGFDTFSKHNLDQIVRELKETDVTIFSVGMAEELNLYGDGGVSYMQAQNQLNTFARMTGGYAWFPRFEAEMPAIFNSVGAFLRNQYTLVFSPTTPQDGKYHKITVELLDDQGNPLELVNKKGKKKKAVVTAREGYTALAAPPSD